MTVSIITVVLNDAEHLEATLQSVLSQEGITLEYVVIDGGSTDGTCAIINAYADRLAASVSEPDRGIADAFNKGLQRVSGDVVGIVNAADRLEPGALARVVQTLRAHPEADVVYGNVRYWKGEHPEYVYRADHTLLPRFMSLNHPAVFARRALYERYGNFDRTYPLAFDYELMLRWYMQGVRFHYHDTTLSNMALGGVSDRGWRAAYREVHAIQCAALGVSPRRYAAYRYRVFRRHVSNLLARLGLERLRALYRRTFSPIKKSLNPDD